jgi:uncharacterized protein (TIGR02246 family)
VSNDDVSDDAEGEVRDLYHAILAGWNSADAEAFAAPFGEDGEVIGFDGSQISGHEAIRSEMARIFADHATGHYVGLIRSVRQIGDVVLLRAVSGVVPAGAEQLNPGLNAVQSLLAQRLSGTWRVWLYQNTPAAFHGRPDLADALTAELGLAFRDR